MSWRFRASAPRGRAGFVGLFVAMLLNPELGRAGTLTGPILNEAVTAIVEDVLEMPVSSGGSLPLARLNVFREVPDTSGRLVVNDLNGPFYVISAGVAQLYMDLDAVFPEFKTSPGLASGFVSFAFHPDFANNGLLYTVHTENVVAGTPAPNLVPAIPTTVVHHSVLNEWQVADPADDSCDPLGVSPNCTQRELIRIAATHRFHNMGEIAFNPNAQPSDPDYGLLYIGAGDYGAAEFDDPDQLQRLDTPYGVLMRIDPLGDPFVRSGITYDYGIPSANPFVDGDPNTFDEIYAYGFRNAHRIAWDTTGVRYVSDIGQGNGEEVNILIAGANYGWPGREGNWGIDPDVDLETPVLPLPADPVTYHYPVALYDHDEGDAIAGGFVHRQPGSPLDGKFIFGDIVNGRIFYADTTDLVDADDGDPATVAQVYELNLIYEGEATTLLQIVQDALDNQSVSRTDLRFGQDVAGNLYVTTKQDGFIRRLRLPDPPDSDGDGIFDPNDNCIDEPNADQCDSNLDGLGNLCDPDTTNDGAVGIPDFNDLRSNFGQVCPTPWGLCADTDFTCDGVVGLPDFNVLRSFFGGLPGLSGLACAGTVPCPASACPHDVCVEGGPLHPACGSCAEEVCTADPDCCISGWGATCVEQAGSICGVVCGGVFATDKKPRKLSLGSHPTAGAAGSSRTRSRARTQPKSPMDPHGGRTADPPAGQGHPDNPAL